MDLRVCDPGSPLQREMAAPRCLLFRLTKKPVDEGEAASKEAPKKRGAASAGATKRRRAEA